MSYLLVIWTVVATHSYMTYQDWRPIGEFRTEAACYAAVRQLNVKADKFRCVPTGDVR